jgi:hydroxymethylpyrimidine pyrophosphatase-like HAD family hydrolase
MAAGIRLISTDFDGTLIGHPSDGRCVPALAHALSEFKAGGGLWAVNTGRSLAHTIEGVAIFDAPVQPDFLLTHEREIYQRDDRGKWSDFGEWNRLSRSRHAELYGRSGPIFAQISRLLGGAKDVNLIEENGHPIGLITSDESVMARVAGSLDQLRGAVPNFNYQRNTIYLRFCHADYHKGSSLGELSRLLGIEAAEVFAAGDHYNDLPMLDPRFASHVACPANAISEVRSAVASAGGQVATAPYGDGVALALLAALQKKPAAVETAAGGMG